MHLKKFCKICFFAGVAQLVEQLIRNEKVAGSIPVPSTTLEVDLPKFILGKILPIN